MPDNTLKPRKRPAIPPNDIREINSSKQYLSFIPIYHWPCDAFNVNILSFGARLVCHSTKRIHSEKSILDLGLKERRLTQTYKLRSRNLLTTRAEESDSFTTNQKACTGGSSLPVVNGGLRATL